MWEVPTGGKYKIVEIFIANINSLDSVLTVGFRKTYDGYTGIIKEFSKE